MSRLIIAILWNVGNDYSSFGMYCIAHTFVTNTLEPSFHSVFKRLLNKSYHYQSKTASYPVNVTQYPKKLLKSQIFF